jgi:hypothetical protein
MESKKTATIPNLPRAGCSSCRLFVPDRPPVTVQLACPQAQARSVVEAVMIIHLHMY